MTSKGCRNANLQFLACQVEVEIILAAHRLYTEQGCLGGIDSLVNLTALSVVRWANHQEFRPLATLAAGEIFVDPSE